MAKHEFGLIDPEEGFEYKEYNPELYNCISVADELIEPMLEDLLELKTYFHSLNRPEVGLAYCGITLIPPDTTGDFMQIVGRKNEEENEPELKALEGLIQKAIEQGKYLIHFGI